MNERLFKPRLLPNVVALTAYRRQGLWRVGISAGMHDGREAFYWRVSRDFEDLGYGELLDALDGMLAGVVVEDDEYC